MKKSKHRSIPSAAKVDLTFNLGETLESPAGRTGYLQATLRSTQTQHSPLLPTKQKPSGQGQLPTSTSTTHTAAVRPLSGTGQASNLTHTPATPSTTAYAATPQSSTDPTSFTTHHALSMQQSTLPAFGLSKFSTVSIPKKNGVGLPPDLELMTYRKPIEKRPTSGSTESLKIDGCLTTTSLNVGGADGMVQKTAAAARASAAAPAVPPPPTVAPSTPLGGRAALPEDRSHKALQEDGLATDMPPYRMRDVLGVRSAALAPSSPTAPSTPPPAPTALPACTAALPRFLDSPAYREDLLSPLLRANDMKPFSLPLHLLDDQVTSTCMFKHSFNKNLFPYPPNLPSHPATPAATDPAKWTSATSTATDPDGTPASAATAAVQSHAAPDATSTLLSASPQDEDPAYNTLVNNPHWNDLTMGWEGTSGDVFLIYHALRSPPALMYDAPCLRGGHRRDFCNPVQRILTASPALLPDDEATAPGPHAAPAALAGGAGAGPRESVYTLFQGVLPEQHDMDGMHLFHGSKGATKSQTALSQKQGGGGGAGAGGSTTSSHKRTRKKKKGRGVTGTGKGSKAGGAGAGRAPKKTLKSGHPTRFVTEEDSEERRKPAYVGETEEQEEEAVAQGLAEMHVQASQVDVVDETDEAVLQEEGDAEIKRKAKESLCQLKSILTDTAKLFSLPTLDKTAGAKGHAGNVRQMRIDRAKSSTPSSCLNSTESVHSYKRQQHMRLPENPNITRPPRGLAERTISQPATPTPHTAMLPTHHVPSTRSLKHIHGAAGKTFPKVIPPLALHKVTNAIVPRLLKLQQKSTAHASKPGRTPAGPNENPNIIASLLEYKPTAPVTPISHNKHTGFWRSATKDW